MLTKQQQDILDNAPSDATHCAMDDKAYYYKDILSKGYMFLDSMGNWMPGKSVPIYRITHNLADLRQMQKPTVFDVVNKTKSVATTQHSATEVFVRTNGSLAGRFETGTYCQRESMKHEAEWICTIEEFNQCVDDLAMWANKPKGVHAHNYTNHKLNNPQPKPRMKVEYVVINGGDKVICGVFASESVYYLHANSHDSRGVQYSEVKSLEALSCASTVYRKVETPMTWQDEVLDVVNSKVADFEAPYIEFKGDEVVIDGRLNIDVFKSICKLVTSLTK